MLQVQISQDTGRHRALPVRSKPARRVPKADPIVKLIDQASEAYASQRFAHEKLSELDLKFPEFQQPATVTPSCQILRACLLATSTNFTGNQNIRDAFRRGRKRVRQGLRDTNAAIRLHRKAGNSAMVEASRSVLDSFKRDEAILTLKNEKRLIRKLETGQQRLFRLRKSSGMFAAEQDWFEKRFAFVKLFRKINTSKPTTAEGALALLRFVNLLLSSTADEYWSHPTHSVPMIERAHRALRHIAIRHH